VFPNGKLFTQRLNVYNTVTLPLCSAMNIRLVQLAQECMDLTIEEMKVLIDILKDEVKDSTGWRKRQILEQMERETND